ncbi:MAG: ribosome small subunit-dependent GTPase A [Ruminococcaceae bacterium]|nr:ribosome small subunit-dependent GTPase A [Oscillospiraceae bacterium]
MTKEHEEIVKGIIVRLTGGFYYVDVKDEIFECKARGKFRKQGESPVVGDMVEISLKPDGYHSIERILERKNYLVRPPLANLDALVIVISTVDPLPNTLVIDKLTAAAVDIGTVPYIVFSKTDVKECDELAKVYSEARFPTFTYSDGDEESVAAVRNALEGKLVAFIGNSGVGKSTLINNLYPELNLKTGQVSQKLGRGRHTTRTVELFKTDSGYVADTPGFSTMDLESYHLVSKDQLMYCFPEFNDYLNECRFTSCMHICEKGCAVIEAVNNGAISKTRHESYIEMYNEIKDIKPWELK